MFNLVQSLSSTKRKLIISAFLIAVSSYFATITLINSQNTLHKNPFWYPYKGSFYGFLNGGIESLVSRQVVADEKLRTIHQRVFSKENLIVKSIEFKFRLSRLDTFVDVLFNADRHSYEAVRISTQSWRPLFHFKALNTGKYLWRKDLETFPPVRFASSAKLEEANGQLILSIGEKNYPLMGAFYKGRVGFDISQNASIWDPVIHLKDGKSISAPFTFKESNFFKLYILNLSLISAIVILGLVLPIKDYNKAFRIPLAITLFVILFYIFDAYYYSKKTFTFDVRNNTFLDYKTKLPFDFESLRFRFFRNWYQLASEADQVKELEELKAKWPDRVLEVRHCLEEKCEFISSKTIPPKKSGAIRIMIWGGSFSVGSGLESPRQTYAEVLHKGLREKFLGKTKIESLNSARMLGTLEENMAFFEQDLELYKPDILLIDAIIWDHTVAQYEKLFRKISGKAKEIILVRIPFNSDLNSYLSRQEHLNILKDGLVPHFDGRSAFVKHDAIILRWVKELGIKYVDPNISLLSDQVYFGGQIFWDEIHITAYAHEEWAKYLLNEVTPYINDEISGRIERPLK